MRQLFLLFITAMLLSNPAWASTTAPAAKPAKTAKAKKCRFPKTRKTAPEWVCDQSKEHLALSAVGYSPKSKGGLEFMKDMATADARAKIVNQAFGRIRKRIAEQETAAGKSPAAIDNAKIEKLAQATLEGSKIIKSTGAPRGALYVLVGMNEEDAQKLYDTVARQYAGN